jgi:hypothetical protein
LDELNRDFRMELVYIIYDFLLVFEVNEEIFFLYVVTLTVRTFNLRFSFKFFDREEDGKLMAVMLSYT